MRIHLKTTPNTIPVPFDYQQKLVGTIHKWIGKNDIHGKISLYSFSWLSGGKRVCDALQFDAGATMFISFHDDSVIRSIVKTILNDSEMFCGLRVEEVTFDNEDKLCERELFHCASPILIKRKLDNGRIKHYDYNDEQANILLKETLLSKMKEVGIEDETLDIRFDLSYAKKRTKLVHYRGIGNKASICPVLIKCKPQTKVFVWNVGLGNSTGIGFGAIY